MDRKELSYWLAAIHLPNIEPRTVIQWLTQFTDMQSLFCASRDEQLAKGLSPKAIEVIKQVNWQLIEDELAWAEHANHHVITLTDPNYPALLKEILDPPLVLFVQGNKSVLNINQLAMVGARNATAAGLQNANWFARALVEYGYAITSGLALGIDAASHKGALAAGGVTMGVAGTGLNHVYPKSHKSLVKEIVEKGGAVISEFPLSTPPLSWHFPRRNRIIGGMSLGVLVVEAALKSGSLITARHALEQGREVFAIPGSIHNALARGCHYLIRQGAKLVETAVDIIEELGALSKLEPVLSSVLAQDKRGLPVNLTREEFDLLSHIEYEITPMDVILLRSGLTAGKVSSILLLLELNGYIQSVPGGYIRTILN